MLGSPTGRYLVLVVAAATAVVALAAPTVGSEGCPCIVLAEWPETPAEGERLSVRSDLQELSTSSASWLQHGFMPPAEREAIAELSPDGLCAAVSHLGSFSLSVDGEFVQPQCMQVCPCESTCPPCPCTVVVWRFVFPAGYFLPGIHVLTGTWRWNTGFPAALWCASYPSPELVVQDGIIEGYEDTDTLTLVVTP
jgi:hypothetical protein